MKACAKRIAIAGGLALACLASKPAAAADMAPAYKAPPAEAASPWRFDITPYAWMPSLNGSSTIRGITANIDASFFGNIIHREIPKQLFGLMTSFEARNDRFAVVGDFTYLLLGADKGGARSAAFAQIDATFDTQIKMVIFELAGAYEIARWSGTAIDVYGGGRVWWQQAEASVSVAAAASLNLIGRNFTIEGGRAVARSGDVSWIDPIIGLRLRHQFTSGGELTLSGDVGGFGVGSQFSWQALGAYRWKFATTKNAVWSGMLGYRALYADYSKGQGDTRYEFDMLQHGPIVGISARF